MIQSMLICDSTGYAFYSHNFKADAGKIHPQILSGLISAIGTVGKSLFNEEIATIYFGENTNTKNSITIISKEMFGSDKSIYFVFMTEGQEDLKKLRALCTNIFIETKNVLKNPEKVNADITDKIDRIIFNKFKGI